MKSCLVMTSDLSLCTFRSVESLQSLLNVSSTCGFSPGRKSASRGSTKCGEPVSVIAILEDLVDTNIPSAEAETLLERLANHQICSNHRDASHGYCSELAAAWRARIWCEYTTANGMSREHTVDFMPQAFLPAEWERKIKALGQFAHSLSAEETVALSIRGRAASSTTQTADGRRNREASTPAIPSNVPSMFNTGKRDGKKDASVAAFNYTLSIPPLLPQNEMKPTRIAKTTADTTHAAYTNTSISPGYASKGEGGLYVDATGQRTPSKAESYIPSCSSSPASVYSDDKASVFDRSSPDIPTPASLYTIESSSGGRSKARTQQGDIEPLEDDVSPYTPSRSKANSEAVIVEEEKQSIRSIREEPASVTSKRLPGREEGESDEKTSPEHQVDAKAAGTQVVELKVEEEADGVIPQPETNPTIHIFVKKKEKPDVFGHVLSVLKKGPVGRSRAPGYVYCFRHEGKHDGYLKIGYAQCPQVKMTGRVIGKTASMLREKKYYEPLQLPPHKMPPPVMLRCANWTNSCGYDTVNVFSYSMPCAAYKMETLVQAELTNHRQTVENCNPDPPYKCSTNHVEWFQVDKETARKTVHRWQRFSECQPYDAKWNLTGDWLKRVEKAEKMRFPNTPNFGQWMDEQLDEVEKARAIARESTKTSSAAPQTADAPINRLSRSGTMLSLVSRSRSFFGNK